VNYSYDVVNRLTTIDYPTGTPDVTFTYNALGNYLTMLDVTGTTSFTYDALYRPTSIQDGASATIGYAYDAAGRRTSITYPGSTGNVTYGYDNANRLTSVTDFQSKTTSYTYDNANRLTSTTLGNGLISDRTYDNADRLLTVLNRNGGTAISSYTYTLDAVGNRTQVVDTSGTSTYTYDGLYRLTGVTYPNSDTQSYTYDAMGNRLTKVHNGTTTSYTYDDLDEMTAAGGVTHTYDNNGSQTAAGSNSWSWDAANRLTSATIGGVSSSYTYNGAGVRTSRTVGGTTIGYTWDLTGSLPNVLQDSNGNKYVYGLDLISQTDSSAAQQYFLYDGLGSTTGISNGTGSVTGTYAYDAFGAVRSQTGVTTEWSFTGEQNDPTGLQYLRARYYDTATGRFIARDPLALMQRYSYADANPINFIDPSGLVSQDDYARGARAAAAVLVAAGNPAGAAILLMDCWRTHAFCPHIPINWKGAAKATAKSVVAGVRWCAHNTTCVTAVATAVILVGAATGNPALVVFGTGMMASIDFSGCMNGDAVSCGFFAVDVATFGSVALGAAGFRMVVPYGRTGAAVFRERGPLAAATQIVLRNSAKATNAFYRANIATDYMFTKAYAIFSTGFSLGRDLGEKLEE